MTDSTPKIAVNSPSVSTAATSTPATTASDLVIVNNEGRIQLPILHKSDLRLDERQEQFMFEAVSDIQTELRGIKDQSQRSQIIINILNQLPDDLRANPLIEQVKKDSLTGNYSASARLIDDYNAIDHPDPNRKNFLLAEFEVPFIRELREPSFELITFQKQKINPQLKKVLPSEAIAIKNIRGSKGFRNPVTVAVFRENIKGTEGTDASAKAYYFVSKFTDRIVTYTAPMMADFLSKDSLPDFQEVANSASWAGLRHPFSQEKKEEHDAFRSLIQVNSNWLSAHEHLHAQSPLPRIRRPEVDYEQYMPTEAGAQRDLAINNIPYGYKLKHSRVTGAFEELRVDIEAILKTYDKDAVAFFGSKKKLTRELILGERLMRYALLKDPNENFDAITSNFLINYLQEAKVDGIPALRLTQNSYGRTQLVIADDEILQKAFEQLSAEIKELELEISRTHDLSSPEGMKAAKAQINEFMTHYSNLHKQASERDEQEEYSQAFQIFRNEIEAMSQTKDLIHLENFVLRSLEANSLPDRFGIDIVLDIGLRRMFKKINNGDTVRDPLSFTRLNEDTIQKALGKLVERLDEAALTDGSAKTQDYKNFLGKFAKIAEPIFIHPFFMEAREQYQNPSIKRRVFQFLNRKASTRN